MTHDRFKQILKVTEEVHEIKKSAVCGRERIPVQPEDVRGHADPCVEGRYRQDDGQDGEADESFQF